MSAVDEITTAAAALRNGIDDNLEDIPRWLAEPLAKLLAETADVMTWLGPPINRDGHLWDGMGGRRSEWDQAISVARVINRKPDQGEGGVADAESKG